MWRALRAVFYCSESRPLLKEKRSRSFHNISIALHDSSCIKMYMKQARTATVSKYSQHNFANTTHISLFFYLEQCGAWARGQGASGSLIQKKRMISVSIEILLFLWFSTNPLNSIISFLFLCIWKDSSIERRNLHFEKRVMSAALAPNQGLPCSRHRHLYFPSRGDSIYFTYKYGICNAIVIELYTLSIYAVCVRFVHSRHFRNLVEERTKK